MSRKLCALISLLCIFSSPLLKANTFYIGGYAGAAAYDYDVDYYLNDPENSYHLISSSPSDEAWGVGALLGGIYHFDQAPFIGLEAFAETWVNHEADTHATAICWDKTMVRQADVSLDHVFGILLRPGVSFYERQLLLYALAGVVWGYYEVDTDTGDVIGWDDRYGSNSQYQVGGRFGVGVEHIMSNGISVRADLLYSVFDTYDEKRRVFSADDWTQDERTKIDLQMIQLNLGVGFHFL